MCARIILFIEGIVLFVFCLYISIFFLVCIYIFIKKNALKCIYFNDLF